MAPSPSWASWAASQKRQQRAIPRRTRAKRKRVSTGITTAERRRSSRTTRRTTTPRSRRPDLGLLIATARYNAETGRDITPKQYRRAARRTRRRLASAPTTVPPSVSVDPTTGRAVIPAGTLDESAQIRKLSPLGPQGEQLARRSARRTAGPSDLEFAAMLFPPTRAITGAAAIGQAGARALGSASRARRVAAGAGRASARGTARASRSAAARYQARRVAGRTGRKGSTRRVERAARRRAYGQAAAVSPAIPAAGIGAAEQAGLFNVATAPVEIGRATVEDPGAVASQSAQSLRDIFLGIPQAIATAVSDPGKAAEMILDDIEHRYGPLARGDREEFRRIVKEEGGVTPFALDALIVAPPAGRIAGGLARRGALGGRVQRAATEPRRPLRTAAEGAETPPLSRNLLTAGVQKTADIARFRRTRTRARRGDPLAVEALRSGQSVPFRPARGIRRELGREQGRAFIQLTREQAEEIARGVRKDLEGLSRLQRRALKYAVQLGIRTPEQARAHLPRRIADIEATRREGRGVLRGREAPRAADEVRVMKRILKNPERVFTPELREAARRTKSRQLRLEKSDPGITPDQALRRRFQPLAMHLGLRAQQGESAGDYANRVRAAARRASLSDPGYVASELGGRARRADYALGGSRGATAIPGRFRGNLFRAGIESTSPEVLVRGIARNIKRRHQWRMVADSFERHTFAWSRNRSVAEILLEAQRRGINPERLALYNPRMIRQAARGDSGEGTGAPEEAITDEALRQSFERNTIDGADAAANPQAFGRSRGWSAVPTEVLDELEVRTRANNLLGRVSEVAIQKASRIILGANPPWLAFQVISNAALTILGGAGPVSIVRAQAWWSRLSAEEKAAIEPYLGIGHFASDVRQTKLGASAKQLGETGNAIVDSWRAIKATDFGQRLGRKNPLDALFRADNAQNNFFRRALFYSELRKAAYQRMNQNATAMGRIQARAVNAIRLDPNEQMRFMARNRDDLEAHARHVSDFLGDYTSYTARERAILKRHVMFYGFLRFSLRFAFWTMPTKHPVMSGVMGNLARLSAEEIRDLFGGDVLPFALGNIYLDEGRTVIELRRANPVLNALTEASDLRNVAGMFSPWYGMAASQVFRREMFTGKDFLVGGESTARRFFDIGPWERFRIVANQGFNMFFPTRVAGELTAEGEPQGADTLFFDPRPTQYAEGGEADQRAQERAEQFQAEGLEAFALREFVPFLPRSSADIRRTIAGLAEARASERERLGLEPEQPSAVSPEQGPSRFGGLFSSSGGGSEQASGQDRYSGLFR